MKTFQVDNLNKMSEELKEFSQFLKSSGIDDDAIFFSRLVSCELITNVIKHGGESASFSGLIHDDKIEICISASSFKDLNLNRSIPDIFAESGRGLYILRTVSESIERGDNGEIIVFIKRNQSV